MNGAGISGKVHLVGGTRVLQLGRELLKGAALLEWAWPAARLGRFIGKRALLFISTKRSWGRGVIIWTSKALKKSRISAVKQK